MKQINLSSIYWAIVFLFIVTNSFSQSQDFYSSKQQQNMIKADKKPSQARFRKSNSDDNFNRSSTLPDPCDFVFEFFNPDTAGPCEVFFHYNTAGNGKNNFPRCGVNYCTFYFDDGTSQDVINDTLHGNVISHTYPWGTDYSYHIVFQGKDANGNPVPGKIDEGWVEVQATHNPVHFDYYIDSVCYPMNGCPVHFSSTAEDCAGYIDTDYYKGFIFEWDFGDGTTSTLKDLTHVYANSGEYTVSCKWALDKFLYNTNGSNYTRTKTVIVTGGWKANNYTVIDTQSWTPTNNPFIIKDSYDPFGTMRPINIEKKLTIAHNAILNLNDLTLHFGDSGSIYVAPGGKLIANNCVFDAYSSICNNPLWQGIVVEGDPNQTQSPQLYNPITVTPQHYRVFYAQGILNLSNCTVSNARTGVRCFHGGSVVANAKTQFIDNQIGVSVEPYSESNNLDKEYSSLISNCVFIGNGKKDSPPPNMSDSIPRIKNFIRLEGVKYFKILGNSFSNFSLNNFSQKSIGIKAINASFNIGNAFVKSNKPNSNTFNNLAVGIYADAPSSSGHDFEIYANTFMNCSESIIINGGRYLNILNNQIHIPVGGVDGTTSDEVVYTPGFGLFCNGTQDILSDKNTFIGFKAMGNYGSVIKNSLGDSLANNIYDSLYCGIHFINTLSLPSINKVNFKCNNQFLNMSGMACWINGKIPDQGDGCGSNHKQAFNTFGQNLNNGVYAIYSDWNFNYFSGLSNPVGTKTTGMTYTSCFPSVNQNSCFAGTGGGGLAGNNMRDDLQYTQTIVGEEEELSSLESGSIKERLLIWENSIQLNDQISLINYYLENKNCEKARTLINKLPAESQDQRDIIFISNLLTRLCEHSQSFDNISSAEVAELRNIVSRDEQSATHAIRILDAAFDEVYLPSVKTFPNAKSIIPQQEVQNIDLGVTNTKTDHKITMELFPDPVSNQGTISLKITEVEDIKGIKLFMYNSLGQMVTERSIENSQLEWDITPLHLPTGLYTYLLYQNQQLIAVNKIALTN